MKMSFFPLLLLILTLTACSSSDDDMTPQDDDVVITECSTDMGSGIGDTDTDGSRYCLDQVAGQLSAIDAKGEELWNISVPEDPDPRRAEALAIVNGQPWLIKHAESYGNCGTVNNVFCEHPFFIEPVDPDSANRDIRQAEIGSGGYTQTAGTTDYDYNVDGQDISAVGIGNSLYLAVDVYELLPGGDRSTIDSWQFLGASITRIVPEISIANDTTGQLPQTRRAAQRLYPGQHITQLLKTETGYLLVNWDERSERLDALTLMPVLPDVTRPLLAGQANEVLTPWLVERLRGDALDEQAAQLASLGELVIATATESTMIESNAPAPYPEPGSERDVTEQTTYTCAGGGTLVLDRKDTVNANSSGQQIDEFHYEKCRLQVLEQNDQLMEGDYTLDGVYRDDTTTSSSQFGPEIHTVMTWQSLEMDGPDSEQHITSAEITIDFSPTLERPITKRHARISSAEHYQGGELQIAISDADYAVLMDLPFQASPFYQLTASGSITGTQTDGHTVTVEINPAFARDYLFSETPDTAPTLQFTGEMQVSSNDGSSMTVTASRDPTTILQVSDDARPGEHAILDYRVADGTSVLEETRIMNSILFPISIRETNTD